VFGILPALPRPLQVFSGNTLHQELSNSHLVLLFCTTVVPPALLLCHLTMVMQHSDALSCASPPQHVFVLPCHLAIVMEYANKEDLANFMSGYVFRHVRTPMFSLIGCLDTMCRIGLLPLISSDIRSPCHLGETQ